MVVFSLIHPRHKAAGVRIRQSQCLSSSDKNVVKTFEVHALKKKDLRQNVFKLGYVEDVLLRRMVTRRVSFEVALAWFSS